MATIGLNFFLEGFGEMVWGANVKKLDVGIPDESFKVAGILLNKLELTAAGTAAVLVAVLAVFFQRTRDRPRAPRGGRRPRGGAVHRHPAQDHLGGGVVGGGAGGPRHRHHVGAKSGVQFSLSLIALKALPVLILGGFTSVPGAIVGGLIVGTGEKLGEVYWGPLVGGAIENWFAYMLALVFLVFRPQGLFGERIIERV